MHEPIRDHIETLLHGGRLSEPVRQKVEAHLASCPSCSDELRAMRLHSGVIRSLRVSSAPEPSAGFYARVIQRIEAEGKPSFWSLLLDPVFGLRLVYATASMFLLMGAFLLATAEQAPELASTPVEIMAQPRPAVTPLPASFGEDVRQDREHFLVTMASFSE